MEPLVGTVAVASFVDIAASGFERQQEARVAAGRACEGLAHADTIAARLVSR